jgi:DNA-binding transcriptional MerR regulator
MSLSTIPTYNLKAVIKETGVKADVLRAWERRYGLPNPQRTEGGHRLYSQRDIEMIKWLSGRQGEGLSISRAIELWREQESGPTDPLAGPRAPSQSSVRSLSLPISNLDAFRAAWLEASLDFRESAADQALNQAFSIYPVETVCTEVLQRGLAEIGGLWYENRASVQQEHFASALALRRLEALLAASPAPTRPQTILVGCPAGEWHTFTPLLLTLFLRRRGLNVIYLGANVPLNCFDNTADLVHADLVILASQQLMTAAALQQLALTLSARDIPVAFGGRIFSLHTDMTSRIPGHFLGNRLDTALESVENWLSSRLPAPAPRLASAEYASTLKAFVAQRSHVEAKVDETVHILGQNPDYLVSAHKYLGDNIIAALSLGDMVYLNSEIDWLNLMLKSQNLPTQVVYDYLALYANAVRQCLGEHADPVVDWLVSQYSKVEGVS